MAAPAAWPMQAPFPYFGGKSRAASLIWSRLGAEVENYVEPFAGSLAVLLGRPGGPGKVETVNDVDCLLVNAWRAVQRDPALAAHFADWPVSEADLSARHLWLVRHRAELALAIQADPLFFDARAAGWWIWGACAWIGSGWCSGTGPWAAEGGALSKIPHLGDAGRGINRQIPHLGNAGRGINRQLPHLGDAGQGINRQLPHLGDAGQDLVSWFGALAERLRRVRITCGDWRRVLSPSVTLRHGTTAVLLDPPYSDEDGRTMGLYHEDSPTVAHDVRAWAIANGDAPGLRIALCGYADQHDMPAGWTSAGWTARKGYQGQAKVDRHRAETIWFSPHCLPGA